MAGYEGDVQALLARERNDRAWRRGFFLAAGVGALVLWQALTAVLRTSLVVSVEDFRGTRDLMIGDQPVGNEGRVAPLSQIGVSTGTKVVSWTRDHRRFRYWVRFDGGEAYLFLRNHEPYLGKDGSAEILRTLR